MMERMLMNSPEPMNLGSPSQSPAVNQFMPQFLLGDLSASNQNAQLSSRNQAQSGSKYWIGSSSPPRVSNPLGSSSSYQSLSSTAQRNYSGYDSKLANPNLIDRADPNYHIHSHHYGHYPHGAGSNYSPHHDKSFGSTTIMGGNVGAGNLNEKAQSQVPGAPPVNRLVDIMNKPSFNPPTSNNFLSPNDARTKFNNSEYFNTLEKNTQDLSLTPNNNYNPHRLSPSSPTQQIDSFYTFGVDSSKNEEKLDETWITIFGFPPSATSYVLQEFSFYGQIIRHMPNAQGNWMHIQYQTKLQAKKALSKNGKVLSDSIMVGVMPCIDKKVMSACSSSSNVTSLDSTATSTSTTNPAQSPTSKPVFNRNFSNSVASKLERSQSLRTNVRPLGPYNGPRETSLAATTDSIHSSMDSSKLPKKNTNVISKAMEYMFGW